MLTLRDYNPVHQNVLNSSFVPKFPFILFLLTIASVKFKKYVRVIVLFQLTFKVSFFWIYHCIYYMYDLY